MTISMLAATRAMVVYDTYLREKGKFGSTVLEVHFVTTAGAELSLVDRDFIFRYSRFLIILPDDN